MFKYFSRNALGLGCHMVSCSDAESRDSEPDEQPSSPSGNPSDSAEHAGAAYRRTGNKVCGRTY